MAISNRKRNKIKKIRSIKTIKTMAITKTKMIRITTKITENPTMVRATNNFDNFINIFQYIFTPKAIRKLIAFPF